MKVITDIVVSATNKSITIMQEHLSKYCRTITQAEVLGSANTPSSNDFYQNLNSVAIVSNTTILGLKNALSIASSITGTSSSSFTRGSKIDIESKEDSKHDDGEEQPDVWGVARYVRLFELIETCIRYCDQLSKEITSTGESVYGSSSTTSSTKDDINPGSPAIAKSSNKFLDSVTSESEKLKLCKEEFDSTKASFSQVSFIVISISFKILSNILK
jgi:hypothetical protein